MAKTLALCAAALILLIWFVPVGKYLPVINRFSTASYLAAHSRALLIVDGSKGRGSCFLCEMHGTTVAITNAHVAAANDSFQLLTLGGETFPVRSSAVAVGHDIVKFETTDLKFAGQGFRLMENVEQNAHIGDSVVVFGNAEGARVVTSIKGKVVGIGPNLVEVDAPFVPGNSGSPIVHEKTGQVIGVATYLLVHDVDRNAKEGISEKARRFGYRLDSVRAWEPLNWPRFHAQAVALEQIEKLSEDFVTLFRYSHGNRIYQGYFQTAAMRHAVQTSPRGPAFGTTLDGQSRKAAANRILGELTYLSRSDINAYNFPDTYDYFRRKLDEQIRLRQAIYTALSGQ